MRTTVTLDPDVAEKLNRYAHRNRISFKRPPPFQAVLHRDGFRPGIDPNRLNQLLDELEVEDFVREASESR